MVEVARLAAITAIIPPVTITSNLEAAESSAASFWGIHRLRSSQRASRVMFCPSR